MYSRLSKNQENKSRNRLIINIAGIILILFLLIKFGLPALINFSLFVSSNNGGVAAKITTNTTIFIAPPILTQSFSATNSAAITVNGTAVAKGFVKLFVNNQLVDTTQTKNDGSFAFTNVALVSGQNTITAKVKTEKQESDFSQPLSILFANKSPTLTIDSPSDGQSFSKDQQTIIVKGKADAGVHVTVNGFWAIIDASGNYSYILKLQNGDNTITVDGVDDAGNKTEKTVKVTYSQ